MRIVYKRSLLLIGILIIIIAFIGIGYLFYDKVIRPETEVVVNDELSINYLNGSSIISDGIYNFSVTNSGSTDIYYKIFITEISGMDKDVTYLISSNDVTLNTQESHLEDDQNIVADNILIKALSTQNFSLKVSNNTNTSFKLVVEKETNIEEYFYMTILANNKINQASTKVGEDISTTNEGLIEASDDDGETYYFRGNVDNNYVSFAGLTWRIVRINGDGSVRIILNDVVDTLANYNSDNENYEKFNNTNLYNSLVSYYDSVLKSYDNKIANTKFCGESGKIEGTYNAYTRIVINKIPTFNCLGEKFTSKIGLLGVDEIIYAGGLYDKDNKEYYLYNENIEDLWWTSSLSKVDNDHFYPFIVNASGKITDDIAGSLYRKFRPVISLNKNVTVSGTGSADDPYVVN